MIIQVEPTADRLRPKIDIILDEGEPVPDAEMIRAVLYGAAMHLGNHLQRATIHRLGDDGAEEIKP